MSMLWWGSLPINCPSCDGGGEKSLLFCRKEAKDYCVAVAVLSGIAHPGAKNFLVLFFKKELLSFAPGLNMRQMLDKLSLGLRKLTTTASAPTENDWKIFEKKSVRYLRRQGWVLEAGLLRQYYGNYGQRRVLIFFFPDERDLTELHIMDWNQARIQIQRPTYVFAQSKPHEAYVKLAAEREITLRHFTEVSILDLTDRDHADEVTMQAILKTIASR